MRPGIAPSLLLEQVKNTASWLWSDDRAAAATRILDGATSVEASYRGGDRASYLAFLLAAHFATVATFVPTDVDARIRHHAWAELTSTDALSESSAIVDDVASWDVDPVSARTVAHPRLGRLSGHDGEWLAVRAGALGRAAVLGSADLVERITAQIQSELDREEAIFRESFETKAAEATPTTLAAATILAHNLGDLSRVVSEWPKAPSANGDPLVALRERWVRQGHADSPSRRPAFVAAGALNKALMALENPRWLALRKPRALRGSRDLLLPIGPWLDGWGEAVATHPGLEPSDRADVLAALLEQHGRTPAQEGCLRAIAGLHRATRGGIEIYVPDLPARMRKDALRGRVRDALDVTPSHFAARMERKYRLERDAAWPR